jgi:hypothetical protein
MISYIRLYLRTTINEAHGVKARLNHGQRVIFTTIWSLNFKVFQVIIN